MKAAGKTVVCRSPYDRGTLMNPSLLSTKICASLNSWINTLLEAPKEPPQAPGTHQVCRKLAVPGASEVKLSA